VRRSCSGSGSRYAEAVTTRSFRPSRQRKSGAEVDKLVEAAKEEAGRRRQDYRARSLALHGWICAKCAREFDATTLHLLTVHHRDGNHHNNPPDGSNWENLCAYCHDDEHSRGLLADYLAGDKARGPSSGQSSPKR
jgi:5-methylcytosine-specific restriction endonuclease McrA